VTTTTVQLAGCQSQQQCFIDCYIWSTCCRW